VTPPATRAVLMGDPSHFSVKGGANPHARTRWGTKRKVDRALAIAQWRRLHDLLRELGVRVLVVPPDPQHPGLVYPANAGCMLDVDAEQSLAERRFVLANLLPPRAGEREHYRRVLEAAGIRCEDFDAFSHERGDFFPAGRRHLLTHGSLQRQRFIPPRLPALERVYGFRTDVRRTLLAKLVAPRASFELARSATRRHRAVRARLAGASLAYRAGLAPELDRLMGLFGGAVIELADADAARYANSFSLMREAKRLLMPADVSERLLASARARRDTDYCRRVRVPQKGGGAVSA
jgi:hypothetical protein